MCAEQPRQGYEDRREDRRLRYDSRVFLIKIVQDPKNHFDGGQTWTEWRSETRGYLMGCLPIAKDLLDWAERSGKTPLTA